MTGNARVRLDGAPWSVTKLRRRGAKHAVWLLVAVSTGGAWIFYFADAPRLAVDLVRGEAPGVAYATIAVLTATTYVLGGLLREQVCIYMCPWPRIQGAMLDENSLTVSYNDWRGEPRGRHLRRNREDDGPRGDCVDCNACVAVCPMGIDIRDGQQFECITCALCIDACNGVMERIGRPGGLISYATLSDHNANMALARGPDGEIDPGRTRAPGRGPGGRGPAVLVAHRAAAAHPGLRRCVVCDRHRHARPCWPPATGSNSTWSTTATRSSCG